jgi:CarD family transcriptional regulator
MKLIVNQYVVYPGQGVCQVVAITSKEIAGKEHRYASLKLIEGQFTILAPLENIDSLGIRPLHSLKEIDEIIKSTSSNRINNQTWNARYREYMEGIKSGDLKQIIQIIQDLKTSKLEKELSFGERKMLDTATTLLNTEFEYAKKVDKIKLKVL